VARPPGFLNPFPTTFYAAVQVVPAAPAIFTVNMQGTGAGAIEHGLTYALVTDMNRPPRGKSLRSTAQDWARSTHQWQPAPRLKELVEKNGNFAIHPEAGALN